MPTQEQLDSFYQFASSQLSNGGAELSMDELYGWWRAQHPTSPELAESVAAIRAAYAEMEAGDSGQPARQALRESCQRLGLERQEDNSLTDELLASNPKFQALVKKSAASPRKPFAPGGK